MLSAYTILLKIKGISLTSPSKMTNQSKTMKQLTDLFSAFLCLHILVACSSNPYEGRKNIFEDAKMQQLFEAQDKRETEVILPFLKDKETWYRSAAAEALGSVQDAEHVDALFPLLEDADASVRKAAAYAIGQHYERYTFIPLQAALETEGEAEVRKQILDAMGKLVSEEQANLLAAYEATDDISTLGQAMGLYRLAVRGVKSDEIIAKVIELIAHNDEKVRLYAAHYLGRSAGLYLTAQYPLIIAQIKKEKHDEVRAALTVSLRHAYDQGALQHLMKQSLQDKSYLVRISAARALAAYEQKDFINPLLNVLSEEENPHVRASLAATIAQNANDSLRTAYLNLADIEEDWLSKTLFYGAAIKAQPDDQIVITYMHDLFDSVPGPYAKAQVLQALGHTPKSWAYLLAKVEENQLPAIQTAALYALEASAAHPGFKDSDRELLAQEMKFIMTEAEDETIIGLMADLIANPHLQLKQHFADTAFLEDLKEKIRMPRGTELMISLEKAIAYVKGETYEPISPAFNNPVDWAYVKTIDRDQKVRIKTEKGDIILRLMVEKAPGSVANFLGMIASDYLTGKNFHRVVPNFVVQGGCPRGDGLGSEDYSIRSEFANLNYKAGSVGMASAGKDTEGVQFFITHTATPHLDGRYTIFAEVVEGMDVVHQLVVGDRIVETEILKIL